MTAFTITVQDQAVQAALKALAARVNNVPAMLETIGVAIIERTQRRFETSTGPDGVPWVKNSAATLRMLSDRIGSSKSKRKKDGSLNAKGLREYANKKPLIDTGTLKEKIFLQVSGNTLTVSTGVATADYAAIQQFGGKAGRGHKVTIPARPFLPIHQDDTLYPQEQAEILKALNDFLAIDR